MFFDEQEYWQSKLHIDATFLQQWVFISPQIMSKGACSNFQFPGKFSRSSKIGIQLNNLLLN